MKRFAATLLSVTMILSLAACSSNQEPESTTLPASVQTDPSPEAASSAESNPSATFLITYFSVPNRRCRYRREPAGLWPTVKCWEITSILLSLSSNKAAEFIPHRNGAGISGQP